ncbi:glycosyl transferase family 2 [Chroococcidiopsis thermalis PCC 7203]|uniref:Glycosyl transferase family 2 n=1 Tax=Chroococcidiopsis thermalis (strain PCC 7203) TaxID=251229 RepID=K9U602_CHRTP|nr:glycosyl transferase family 2 [Chroococcidiopsis thermalis PCC 7203]
MLNFCYQHQVKINSNLEASYLMSEYDLLKAKTNLSLPLVSIITPSYNQGKFIRKTIESVLTQNYEKIEYWVIDGGSTDETISILKEYESDSRFHWISESDRGQSDAINKGLARIKGEIFSWLNSDDVLVQNALFKVVSAWMEAEQPSIIYGLARFIDECDNDLGLCPRQCPDMTLEKIIAWKYHLPQPAVFAPVESVREVGGIDLSLHYAMDFDLWIKLAEKIPLKHISYNLALFRLHSASKTFTITTSLVNDIAEVLSRAKKRGILDDKQAQSCVNLLSAKMYMEIGNFSKALVKLKSAVMINPSVTLESATLLVRCVTRFLMGEKKWFQLRSSIMKFFEASTNLNNNY